MARHFLPGLRGMQSQAVDLSSGMESKTIIIGGGNFSSLIQAGTVNYGTEDRASGWDMATVIVDGYERVVWVFKSVEWIAGHAARLPFVIGRNVGSDDEERLEDHPLYRVLNKQANPMETGRQFRKRLSAQILLSKRGAFVEVTRSRMGTITRLDLLPPDRTRPVPDDRGDYISHYEFITRQGELRELAPERVRWFREPHPTDIFSGVTPLEAAGVSVELDHLSRLYNVSFIKNDGRPGGIVGVDTDTLEDNELERIERRFTPGAQNAGQITVIGTGPGGIKYVDTTTRPRDMAYGEAAANAKNEILAAFGLDESVVASVANRTFDNAEQALYNAWTQVEVPHLDLVAGGFDTDIDEEYGGFFDTSTVEVLELPRRLHRREAREEFQQGLRSLDEYRPLAGLDPLDNPYSRALWISPSKAPVPGRPEDAAALGVGAGTPGAPGAPGAPGTPPPDGQPPAGGPAPEQPAPGGSSAAVDAVAEGRQSAAGAAAAAVHDAQDSAAQSTPGDAAAAVIDAEASTGVSEPGDAAAAVADAEGKSLDADIEHKAATLAPAEPTPVVYEPGEDEQRRMAVAVAGAVDALLARQSGVITARLESPKARKGTRYWTPDGPADARKTDAPMDSTKIVDADRWVYETTATLTPVVTAGATDSGAGLLTALAGAGVLAGATESAALTAIAGQAATGVSLLVVTTAAEAIRALLADLAHTIDTEQAIASTVDAISQAVRAFYATRARDFSDSLAAAVATAAVNGARDATAAALAPLPTFGGSVADAPTIIRSWQTRRDEQVRPTHAAVEGRTEPIGTPFPVGGALLRYPGDPLGPARETRNCRCSLYYRTTTAANFLLPPIALDEVAA